MHSPTTSMFVLMEPTLVNVNALRRVGERDAAESCEQLFASAVLHVPWQGSGVANGVYIEPVGGGGTSRFSL